MCIVHAYLLAELERGLNDRVVRGIDEKRLTQVQLSNLAGVAQPNLSAIYHGKPATEATWQRLMDVAWVR